jgi:oxygen-independent coproporphyrinogen-3 oxidase
MEELNELIGVIWNTFNIREDAEITLEANPDDLSEDYLSFLRDTPVNRLSIGIQSLDENDLKYLHRVHNRHQAIQSLKLVGMKGFSAVSADLIFGIPTSSIERLDHDVRIFADYGVEHISAYGLTIEPKTALERLIQLKKTISADDFLTASEMEWLMENLPLLGFHQYEISNYSVPGAEAKHNSSYWDGKPYLGIGPSAHSYHAPVRSWNISNNMLYIKGISAEEPVSYTHLRAHET